MNRHIDLPAAPFSGPLQFPVHVETSPGVERTFTVGVDVSWYRGRQVIEPWTDEATEACLEAMAAAGDERSLHDLALDELSRGDE